MHCQCTKYVLFLCIWSLACVHLLFIRCSPDYCIACYRYTSAHSLWWIKTFLYLWNQWLQELHWDSCWSCGSVKNKIMFRKCLQTQCQWSCLLFLQITNRFWNRFVIAGCYSCHEAGLYVYMTHCLTSLSSVHLCITSELLMERLLSGTICWLESLAFELFTSSISWFMKEWQ